VARERLDTLFETVEMGTRVPCLNCMPYESDLPIWIARGPIRPLPELWLEAKHFQ